VTHEITGKLARLLAFGVCDQRRALP